MDRRFALDGADVNEITPLQQVDCWIIILFPLSINSVQVFFRRKTGQAPLRVRRLSRVNYLGSRAFRATRGSRAPTMLLSNRWRKRRDRLWRRRVLRDPLLAGQLCGRLNDIAMPLLSLDLGGGFSVDSVCHL